MIVQILGEFAFKMDDTTAKTLRHLQACASVLPSSLTQCRIGVNYAAREIQAEKMDQGKSDFCQFCFSQIDVTKANIQIESKKKRKRLCAKGEQVKSELQVKCNFCKKICVSKSLPLSLVKKVSPSKVQSELGIQDTDNSKKKKKRNKKDPNAGLIIPGKSVPLKAKPDEKTKVTISKEKLKHLMSLNTSGKKGGLEDFLKR